MASRVKYVMTHPSAFVNAAVGRLHFLFTDKQLLKIIYRCNMHRPLNLKHPQTFNEKMNWLKLYDRKPIYTTMVDKFAVKDYVAGIIGDGYVIKTLGVWDSFDDIDFESLPDRFVLKTTHGGGNLGVVVCKDKSKLDKSLAKKRLSLKNGVYRAEWPYKNVPHKIIAEQYMEDQKTGELRDYKFFCFDGSVKAMFVASERQNREEPYFDFFDADFNHLDIVQGHPNNPVLLEKPESFDDMKRIASILSKGIPSVRIDMYEVNGKAYFGEITFYHFGGIVPFQPESVDSDWGKWIELPSDDNNRK